MNPIVRGALALSLPALFAACGKAPSPPAAGGRLFTAPAATESPSSAGAFLFPQPISHEGKTRFAYIDTSGRIRIDPAFAAALPFSEGLARAALRQGDSLLFGFIDSAGSWAVPPVHPVAYSFQEGLAVAGSPGKLGLIDRKGARILEPTLPRLSAFRAGFAVAGFGTPNTSEYREALLSRDGTWRTRPDYQGLMPPSEGLMIVLANGRFGIADTLGTPVHPSNLNAADMYSGNRAAAAPDDSTRLFGFLDRAGHWAIPPRYSRAGRFREGLAAVCAPEQGRDLAWSFIDTAGNTVIPGPFADAGEFSEGLAAAMGRGRDSTRMWGYLDRTGRWRIPPSFHLAQPFARGLAQVAMIEEGRYRFGYVRPDGTLAWDPADARTGPLKGPHGNGD